MISKLFSKLPGFRTRKMWKIIIAIPAYLVLVLLFIGILSDGNKFTDSSLDSALKTFHNLIVVLIILIPLMLITNAVNLRTKLHVFKGKSVWKQCMSWFGVVLSIVIILIVVDTVIGNSYTSEYVLAESKYREEQAVIKAQQDAVAAKEKEEKSKADEQEKKLLAEAKEEKRAEEERLKKEQMALAEKQKEEARIKEEQRKLDEEAAKEAEKKKQEELQEKVAQTSDDDVDTIVPKPMEAEPMEVMDGFNLFQTDGFAIQVPYTWHSVSSRFTRSLESKFSTELDVDDTPIRETYDINFKTDMQFTSIIEIRRYDGSEDYEKYAKSYGYGAYQDGFQKVDFENADAAFEWIDYKDSVGEMSSRELVIFKNDVCYIFYSYHDVNHTEGSWANIYRKQIKEFRADLDKIYESFEIIDNEITFADVIQSEYQW